MHKTIIAPVLYGEGETQILIVNDVTLPEPALKIWDVKLIVKDLDSHICRGKVIVQGVLHKQIVFVNKKTNLLQHHQTDIRFNGYMEVPCAEPGMELIFNKAEVKEDCGGEKIITCPELEANQNEIKNIGHYGPPPDEITCVHEKHIIEICVAVFRKEKVCLNNQCPPPNYEKGEKYHDTYVPPMQTGCGERYSRSTKPQT